MAVLRQIIPGLGRGGAQRMAVQIADWSARIGEDSLIHIQRVVEGGYDPEFAKVLLADQTLNWDSKIEAAAEECKAAGASAIITHLSGRRQREILRKFLPQIPVVHNTLEGWNDDPAEWSPSDIPRAICVCEEAAHQIRERNPKIAVEIIRHRLITTPKVNMELLPFINPNHLNLCIIGQIRNQKNHKKALEVIHYLKKFNGNVKLYIAGDWVWDNSENKLGERLKAELDRMIFELDLFNNVQFLGNLNDIEVSTLIAKSHINLSTSFHEGASIALMEAQALGTLSVISDVGGQRKISNRSVTKLYNKDMSAENVGRIITSELMSYSYKTKNPEVPTWYDELSLAQWRWFTQRPPRGDNLLLVTYDVGLGGAQRSLINLIKYMNVFKPDMAKKIKLAVIRDITHEGLKKDLIESGVEYYVANLAEQVHVADRIDFVLDKARELNCGQIWFWNAPSDTKIGVAKALFNTTTKLVDVSPGPALLKELKDSPALVPLNMNLDLYFKRFTRFVVKNKTIPDYIDSKYHDKTIGIVNGVPEYTTDADMPRPSTNKKTVIYPTRIHPSKFLEKVINIGHFLKEHDIELEIYGSATEYNKDYEKTVKILAEKTKVKFFPAWEGSPAFIKNFDMVLVCSEDQGCPNIALEAARMGVAIVANNDGGTGEILNQYCLFKTDDTATAIANKINHLLKNDYLRGYTVRKNKRNVEINFSMNEMVEKYFNLYESLT